MVLIRKGIGRELDQIHDDMERVVNRVFRQFHFPACEGDEKWSPNTDVYETGAEFLIQVEVAGVPKEALEVGIQENVLSIRGQRPRLIREKLTCLHQMEINHGPFERLVSLPSEVDSEGITAHYADGYLTIRLPKTETPKAKTVEIETA